MNRIILIGNGFDIAHKLPTRYCDFINWYWNDRHCKLKTTNSSLSSDNLCSITLCLQNYSWHSFLWSYDFPKEANLNDIARSYPDLIKIEYTTLMSRITQSIETKGWVDIENEYYVLLTKQINSNTAVDLNSQLNFLKLKLAEYLREIQKQNSSNSVNPEVFNIIMEPIHVGDISIEHLSNPLYTEEFETITTDKYPIKTLLLDFNYTSTSDNYIAASGNKISTIHIHGTINEPQSMIFGYGDELDEDFRKLLKTNDNDLIANIKSIRYLETDNYRRLLEFIEFAPYQIFIMGHSCGNSDRTLLNTLFEHKNCASIKIFYHKGQYTDNYLELVQNISRNFTDMKLMRDRVVNKTYCRPLPQIK